MVGSSWINSMFIRDHLPELGSNLVSTLTSLDVYDFPHVEWSVETFGLHKNDKKELTLSSTRTFVIDAFTSKSVLFIMGLLGYQGRFTLTGDYCK